MSKRRQLVVDSSLQRKIVIGHPWPAALAMLAAASTLCVFAAQLGHEAALAGTELPSLGKVIATAFVFVIVSSAFILMNALRFSNRVAGPIHSIRKVLHAHAEGDTEARVRLRSDDFLVSLTDDINAVLEHKSETLEQSEPVTSLEEEHEPEAVSAGS